MKFGMQAILTAAPGKGYELAEIMLKASQVVARLDGCELYIIQQSTSEESKILITEVWDSMQSHQASLETTEVQNIIAEAKPMIVDMEHHPAKCLGGHGL
ncbi:putative quinol monooxygenase [Halomonas elongata]|uniref:putative quinol monooxygenase n=1 Tax=Halomonas elongata TaxID=2746 RepID=UPI0038D4049E